MRWRCSSQRKEHHRNPDLDSGSGRVFVECQSLGDWRKIWPLGSWLKVSRVQKTQRTIYPKSSREPLNDFQSREGKSSDVYVRKIGVSAIWNGFEE